MIFYRPGSYAEAGAIGSSSKFKVAEQAAMLVAHSKTSMLGPFKTKRGFQNHKTST